MKTKLGICLSNFERAHRASFGLMRSRYVTIVAQLLLDLLLSSELKCNTHIFSLTSYKDYLKYLPNKLLQKFIMQALMKQLSWVLKQSRFCNLYYE